MIGKCDVLFINITLGKPRNTDFRFEIRCVDISCDVRESSDKFCLKSVSERNFHPYSKNKFIARLLETKLFLLII